MRSHSKMLASLCVKCATPSRALARGFASVQIGDMGLPGASRERLVTVLPGHGIGPELVNAAMACIKATNAPVSFEVVDDIKDRLTPTALASARKTGTILKGEFVTGVGRGTLPSINVDLRKSLSLFANVVHSFNLPGIPSRHDGVDIVIVRENLEGEFSGMEHEVVPGVTESLKVMTAAGTMRIAEYAFEYAYLNNRAKVTAVHKANIMKKADGLFLESCQAVAAKYPQIAYEEVIVDNCMMQLVSKPQQFDVMVTPNFYGSLVTNAVAGLVGGPGLCPGANIGNTGAMFEQGARHVGLDIAGRDIVNPTGILFSAVLMLRHLHLPNFADRMESAVFATLASGTRTRDIGGTASTSEFVKAITDRLSAEAHRAKIGVKASKGKSVAV